MTERDDLRARAIGRTLQALLRVDGEEALAAFRERRAHGAVEAERLLEARDLLDALGDAIDSGDAQSWERMHAAWEIVVGGKTVAQAMREISAGEAVEEEATEEEPAATASPSGPSSTQGDGSPNELTSGERPPRPAVAEPPPAGPMPKAYDAAPSPPAAPPVAPVAVTPPPSPAPAAVAPPPPPAPIAPPPPPVQPPPAAASRPEGAPSLREDASSAGLGMSGAAVSGAAVLGAGVDATAMVSLDDLGTAGEALPFTGEAEPPPPAADALPPRAPGDVDGTATMEPVSELGETLPFGESKPPVELTAEQYASFCAECAARPDRVAGVRARYGLRSAEDHAVLDAHWRAAFRRDAVKASRHEDLVARYTAWIRAKG